MKRFFVAIANIFFFVTMPIWGPLFVLKHMWDDKELKDFFTGKFAYWEEYD